MAGSWDLAGQTDYNEGLNCMATKVITTLIDDIDGNEADETVSFRIDAVDYEIDLTEANAAALRENLARYIAVARKTAGRTRPAARSKQQVKPDVSSPSSIREWAKHNGYTASTRGRIPSEIREAHEKATA